MYKLFSQTLFPDKFRFGISPNVKVVYDVFGVAIKKLRSSFSSPKNVVEKTAQRA
jgi:hypothetical protein